MGEILKKRVLAPQNDFLMTYPVICGKFQMISTHHTKLSKFTQEHHREILETSYGCLDKKTMNASKNSGINSYCTYPQAEQCPPVDCEHRA